MWELSGEPNDHVGTFRGTQLTIGWSILKDFSWDLILTLLEVLFGRFFIFQSLCSQFESVQPKGSSTASLCKCFALVHSVI